MVTVSVELLQHLRARLGKITDKPDMIAEADQEYAVFWAQNVLEEQLKVTLMLFGELILACAEIHDQSKGEGNVYAMGKEGDFLRHRVFKDLDVVFSQVLEERASRIAG